MLDPLIKIQRSSKRLSERLSSRLSIISIICCMGFRRAYTNHADTCINAATTGIRADSMGAAMGANAPTDKNSTPLGCFAPQAFEDRNKSNVTKNEHDATQNRHREFKCSLIEDVTNQSSKT